MEAKTSFCNHLADYKMIRSVESPLKKKQQDGVSGMYFKLATIVWE